MNTIKELINNGLNKYSNSICLYKNEGEYLTYSELYISIRNLGSYFIKEGFKGKKIAIMACNSYYYAILFLTISYGIGVAVLLDKGLTNDELLVLAIKADVDLLFFDEYTEDKAIDLSNNSRIKIYNIKELNDYMSKGKECYENGDNSFDRIVVKENDLMSMFFTSGTYSNPKIVMLSQKNIMYDACVSAPLFRLSKEDKYYSLLPLSHTYELTGSLITPLTVGASVCFNTNLKRVKEELLCYKPTVINCVPRILELFVGIIKNKIKLNHHENKLKVYKSISDLLYSIGIDVRKIIFKDISNIFGGRIRFFGCGGAKLSDKTFNFLKSLGFDIFLGYGLTETSPLLSVRTIDTECKNNVGKALPGTKIEIRNKNVDGVGEIYVKGPQVMLGYYNNQIETLKSISNSWLNTGDLGYFDKEENLNIIGRANNVIITKNGENIYPEEIENLLLSYEGIKEVLVKGVYQNQVISIVAEIVVSKNITETIIKSIVNEVNSKLSLYKHINRYEIKSNEFDKTHTYKIKRG